MVVSPRQVPIGTSLCPSQHSKWPLMSNVCPLQQPCREPSLPVDSVKFKSNQINTNTNQNECKGTGWDMNHSIVARQFRVAQNGQLVLVRLRCIVVPCWIHPSVDDWQCSIWTSFWLWTWCSKCTINSPLVLTVLRQVFCHIHRWHVCMIPRRSSRWFAFGKWRDQWFLWIGRNVLCHHN